MALNLCTVLHRPSPHRQPPAPTAELLPRGSGGEAWLAYTAPGLQHEKKGIRTPGPVDFTLHLVKTRATHPVLVDFPKQSCGVKPSPCSDPAVFSALPQSAC